ncbi:MAG: Gfo/Idh/MocA family oxidoreductase [Candidatus Poribacteria bacterium]|nr:Gfo/Idh/MocA family oxidoreductase [Candidatus Poribacteria bacterium]
MNPRISMIGTGTWGKILVQKFHQLGGLHLVYGHQNRETLESLNLHFTEDIDALIEESDAVVVATPSETHAEFGHRILAAKKALFLEKPIALSSAEAKDLAALADASDCVFMVGHTLCYSTGFQQLNQLPGHPVSADAKFLKTSTEEKHLNAYWNFGVHMVALGVALDIPPDQLALEASDQAPINQRTFALQTRTDDGKTHSLLWDFLAPENQEDMLMVECQHFLDCLKRQQPPRTDGWQGVRTIQILESIHPEQRK